MDGDVGVDVEATLPQPLDLLRMAGETDPVGRADPVGPDRQRPLRRGPGIVLADRPGGRVAGVGEGRQAGIDPLLVELREVGDRQVDLAPDLDQRGRVIDLIRDGLDRLDVPGDVLPHPAVTTGRALDQPAVLVGEGDRQAVDLRLGDEGDLAGVDVTAQQMVADPGLPGGQLLLGPGVGERKHRHRVLDRGEAGRGRGPDPLGRRVAGDQLGMFCLQRLQFREELVVLLVGDLRVVLLVVEVDVMVQLLVELGDPFGLGTVRCPGGQEEAAPSSRSKSRSRRPSISSWWVQSRLSGVTVMWPRAIAPMSVSGWSSRPGS